MAVDNVKILIFDTFGTVTDWHGTIVGKGRSLTEKYGLEIDWHKFANDWRFGYFEITEAIARKERPYIKIDQVFQEVLDTLLIKYRMEKCLSMEDLIELKNTWHRLNAWEEASMAINRMKTGYMVGPFTNGDFRMMIDIAKYGSLNWDFILTADIFHKFKPDPSVYYDAVRFLDADPKEILMVAAHPKDLDGAKRIGCRTAYVMRKDEYGKDSSHKEAPGEYEQDLVVSDFSELAQFLGV